MLSMIRPAALLPGALALLMLAGNAQAQAPRSEGAREQQARTPDGGPRLPAASTTSHSLALAGRTLAFKASAGSLRLIDPQGAPQMEIAYTAFIREGGEPRQRPVVFALNGGPGSASAWLNLGALGPWRLPMEGAALAPSAPPVLLPNEETWLDFADLVFIDPVGTGFSRLIRDTDELKKQVWSVGGDIDVLSSFIRRWLAQNDRLASPKYIVGESYGGFRAPRIARRLQGTEGVGVDGLILVSPVLDFRRFDTGASPLWAAALLPGMAAAHLDSKGTADPAALAEAEAYARGEYIVDLLKGPHDEAAQARIAARVSELTGLDPQIVRRLGGEVDSSTFRRERLRDSQQVASIYDATVTAPDPDPYSPWSRFADPVLDGLTAPLTSAMTDLLHTRLNWKPEGRYMLLGQEANRHWDWGRGRASHESLSALTQALALDPRLRVLVAHGSADLVTPYFESRLLLDQLPKLGEAPRVRLTVHPGGHMFYSRDKSRQDFREEARRMISGE